MRAHVCIYSGSGGGGGGGAGGKKMHQACTEEQLTAQLTASAPKT